MRRRQEPAMPHSTVRRRQAVKSDTGATTPGANEIGTIRKSWRGRTTVALVYPNRYHVGMSNLGLQSVYGLLNGFDDVVCERVFCLKTANRPPAA
jgi:hypothetical protein